MENIVKGTKLNLTYNGKARRDCIVDTVKVVNGRVMYTCSTPEGWKQFDSSKVSDLQVVS